MSVWEVQQLLTQPEIVERIRYGPLPWSGSCCGLSESSLSLPSYSYCCGVRYPNSHKLCRYTWRNINHKPHTNDCCLLYGPCSTPNLSRGPCYQMVGGDDVFTWSGALIGSNPARYAPVVWWSTKGNEKSSTGEQRQSVLEVSCNYFERFRDRSIRYFAETNHYRKNTWNTPLSGRTP